MTANRDSEMNKRYGNLFDGILDRPQVEYKTQKEIEKETQSRYGHLLDGVGTGATLYDSMMEIENSCRRERRQREEDDKQANIRMQERIERERWEEKERNNEKMAFVNFFIEKNEAEKRARREAEEKRRLEAEREQNVLNSLRRMGDIAEKTSEKINQDRLTLERDEQHRKELEQQNEWYRKQQRWKLKKE